MNEKNKQTLLDFVNHNISIIIRKITHHFDILFYWTEAKLKPI